MVDAGQAGEGDEYRLIRKIVLGADQRVFTSLMRPYVAPIRGYLGRFVTDVADADDLTQETLLKAWNQLHRFDGRGRFKAWLFAIAHREFLQHARGKRRYWRAMSGLRREPGGMAVSDNAAVAGVDVATVLASMDEDTRAMVLLSRGLGLTHVEIATVTGKPLGTVKSTISRATRMVLDDYA